MVIVQFISDDGEIIVEVKDDDWIRAVDVAYSRLIKIGHRPIVNLVIKAE